MLQVLNTFLDGIRYLAIKITIIHTQVSLTKVFHICNFSISHCINSFFFNVIILNNELGFKQICDLSENQHQLTAKRICPLPTPNGPDSVAQTVRGAGADRRSPPIGRSVRPDNSGEYLSVLDGHRSQSQAISCSPRSNEARRRRSFATMLRPAAKSGAGGLKPALKIPWAAQALEPRPPLQMAGCLPPGPRDCSSA